MKRTFFLIFTVFVVFANIHCGDGTSENSKHKIDTIIEDAESLQSDDPTLLAIADSAFQLSKQLNYQLGESRAITLKGSYFYSNKNYSEALASFERALFLSSEIDDKRQSAILYEKIGLVHNKLKDKETCINYFKKSVELRKELKDSVGLGTAYNNIGYIFWQGSMFDSALVFFKAALDIRKRIGDKEPLASTSNNIGTIYYQWSIYDKALEYYLTALKLRKELNDNSGIALIYSNIGLVYSESSQKEKAIEYFREGLSYSYESGDSQAIGYAYHCLGSAFRSINSDSALYCFRQAYKYYDSIRDVGGNILALKGLGDVYLIENDLMTARSYFERILRLSKDNNIPLRTAEAYKYLGEISKKENNLSKAEDYLLKSIELSAKINIKTFLRDAYKLLSDIQEQRGNINDALSSLKQFEYYKFQIEDDAMQRRLTALKNNFEFEKYQRNLEAQKYENEKQKIFLVAASIAVLFLSATAFILIRLNKKKNQINYLLNQKNKLIEGQSNELSFKNQELVESNIAKDKLFSIVAHDLKNPFFILINLTSILKEEYHELTERERLDMIGNIEQTSRKTHELLENLLNLSLSRTGRIEFNPVVTDLNIMINNIKDLYTSELNNKGIKIINNIAKGLSVYADPNMIEIVIRNLINNAVKYSHQGSEVTISAQEKDDNVTISIEDNGVGMDSHTLENIFNINLIKSQSGTHGERGTGLGLGLCKEFVEKNNGNISAESESGKGSAFYISLPKYESIQEVSENYS